MSSDASEGTHICVRCGNGNGSEAAFCVECGFDLSSALQRDYDSYRDVSRGDLTLSESDCIPVSVIRTLTGMPAASSDLHEDAEGAPEGAETPAQVVAESVEPTVSDEPSEEVTVDEVETRIEVEGIVPDDLSLLADGDDVEEVGIEPLPMDQIEDPFAPSAPARDDHPKSRPVHENLRKGVTTYVDATERGFRRSGAPEEKTSLAISIGSALAIGSVIFVLILVLTR